MEYGGNAAARQWGEDLSSEGRRSVRGDRIASFKVSSLSPPVDLFSRGLGSRLLVLPQTIDGFIAAPQMTSRRRGYKVSRTESALHTRTPCCWLVLHFSCSTMCHYRVYSTIANDLCYVIWVRSNLNPKTFRTDAGGYEGFVAIFTPINISD